jgi:hypothetical protein
MTLFIPTNSGNPSIAENLRAKMHAYLLTAGLLHPSTQEQ